MNDKHLPVIGSVGRLLVAGASQPWEQAMIEALSRQCEVTCLNPEIHASGLLPFQSRADRCILPLGTFSHRRWLAQAMAPLASRRLRRRYGRADALILTHPHHWPLAVYYRSLAPLVGYWVSDDLAHYGSPHPQIVLSQESLIVRHADVVFTVSRRLADVLAHRHRVDSGKFCVIPNGVPASWIPPHLPTEPEPFSYGSSASARPLVGIIGVIGDRIDLDPVVAAHDALPELDWLFVGPIRRQIPGLRHLQESPRCRFTGSVPYEGLQEHFAAVDVAVLPFTDGDINPCSSPVRFYSQLPTGQPILHLGSCDQLLEHPELADWCAGPDDLIRRLKTLLGVGFRDGRARARHAFAKQCTWDQRAAAFLNALADAQG